MLSRISQRFCRYARTYACWFRRLARKNLSFLQRRAKFSEGRSERPDVTAASAGTPPALRTGGKGVWSHTTDNTYAFRFKDFTFNTSNVFTGWVIIAIMGFGPFHPRQTLSFKESAKPQRFAFPSICINPADDERTPLPGSGLRSQALLISPPE